MKRILLLLVLSLSACQTKPPSPEPEFSGIFKNACLPEAIAMAQSLRKHGIQAKVLTIYAPNYGHAVTTYLYPPGQNQLWAWDSYWKSLRIHAYTNNPESIAKNWLSKTNQLPLTKASFLED